MTWKHINRALHWIRYTISLLSYFDRDIAAADLPPMMQKNGTRRQNVADALIVGRASGGFVNLGIFDREFV